MSADLSLLGISLILQAIAGSSTLAIMSGMFVDFLTDPTSRGIATAVFSLSVFCGPAVGPIIGNLVTARLGWRWASWITLIISVVFGIIAFLATLETSETIILQSRAQRLRRSKRTGNNVVCEVDQRGGSKLSAFVERYLTKPLWMIILEPIFIDQPKLAILTIYMSFVYGIIYLTFTLYP
ncbi:hypothetical protein CSUB01_01618 [Colletotrichum sublineola]|uniref:Major facilitator superfamily (MFS) profile domain-containing protein n=1 Tax=Colletotrichum sublineola TaxID=1173701 RepID=A0A066XV96_COLSU|nr:hypothetical protein CSUB01_01618 [Colletotrichum sublineola]